MGQITSNYFTIARWIQEWVILSLKPKPRSVALFGSFVRGEDTPTSDLDLLLIGSGIPRKPYLRSLWIYPLHEAWRENRCRFQSILSISPLIMSDEGWTGSTGLRLSLSREAWILLDDGFLSTSLLETSQWIEEGKWVRKNLPSGGWAWIPGTHAA